MVFARAGLLSLAGLLAIPPVAVAQGAPAAGEPAADTVARIEALAAEGAAAYDAKDYEKAVKLYLDAWKLDPVAGIALLYNIAVIYDYHIQDPRLARTYYRRYLESPDADPGLLPKATERLAAMEARIAEEAAAAAASTVTPPEQPAPPVTPPAEVPAAVEPAPLTGAVTPVSPRGSSSGPLLVMGTGAALTLIGGAFGVLTLGQHAEFETNADPDEKARLRDSGRTYGTVADIGIGVGLATVVGGLIWYLADDGDAPESAGVQVTPMGVRGRF